ncbi:AAA family ATPase [Streptomyces sp. MBT62]|uniref:ATP-binding protein n=1 Tax=Streptomyces sp. MBT62 TaxID=2800410 RepID=UPI001909145D|nr:AAA family ATPase [Streptomyces sp. MBT62]MBK3565430.1 AAA family ATPase [Streptomyces sp. MBT62]
MPGRMPETVFLGREDELARMAARLRRAGHSEPQVVVVDGPAGIGKTSLVRRFLKDLGAAYRVLRASGSEGEADLPYGVLAQLVAGLADEPDAPLRDLNGCGRAGSALPDPIGVGSALIDALGRAQDRSPVVLVIDDMNWADTPSLHALTFVLRRLRVDRVLTLLAARDTVDPRLPAGLRRVLAEDSTLKLTLDGLGVDELAEFGRALGTAPLSRRAATRLQAHTHGNPLHTRALLDQVPRDVLAASDATLPAPRSYARLVNDGLAACTFPAQRLVAAASVLGMSSPLHKAARVGEVATPLDALEEAVAAGLLAEEPAVDLPRATFAHPLQRAAVYQGLGPRRRSHLHEAAARLADEPAEALRHRARAAVQPDAGLADELAAYAARQADEGAWSAAAAYLMSGARLTADRTRAEERTVQAVEYLLLAGDVGQAVELTDTVRALPRTAQQQYVLGRLALESGRQDEARRELTAAWRSRSADTEPETVRCVAEQMAWLCLIQSDARGAVSWARRGLDTGPGDRASLLRDELTLALALTGRFDEGLKAVADLPEHGPYSGAKELDGLFARGALRTWNGEYDAACRDLSESCAAHRKGGLPSVVAPSLGYLADAEYRAGRWDEAIAHSTQAVSLAEDTDHKSMLALAHAVAAYPLAGRGDFPAAREHVRCAIEYANRLADANDLAYAMSALALLRAAESDHAGVVEALSPLLGPELAYRDAIDEPGVFPWRHLLVEGLVRTGRTREAEAVLVPYETLAEARGRRPDMAAAARCRGMVEGARGDTDAAERAFRAGLRHCGQDTTCWERALLHLAYGAFLRRGSKRGAAAVELDVAWAAFTRLDAVPFLERCRTELAACGRASARPRTASHSVLTPQELTVGNLAAQGLSNRQIARELALSIKTIEYHLGHIYAKLGLTSRVGLVAALAPSP